jgi:UDP-glucose 4-epimerase
MIKKIFITGGLGVVGKELIKLLIQDNYNLICIDTRKQISRNFNFIQKNKVKVYACDILDKKKILRLSKKQDCIIHLAAMLGVKNTETNIKKCWMVNVAGTQNIIDAYNSNKIKKIVFSSSSEVYGEATVDLIDENQPLLGRNIYACSKIAAENIILNNRLVNKSTNYTIFRLFNTYGQSQVAKFFIPKICKSLRENKKIIINGNGKQIRGYSYASDIAKAIKSSISKNISKNKIYNVGNSKEAYNLNTVLKLLSKIKKIRKNQVLYKKNFANSDRNKNREIFNRLCNLKKIEKELGFKAEIKLSNGLKMVMSKTNKIYNGW